MTQDQKAKARRLLEAQIEFLQAEISGDRFAELVATEVDHALRAAEALTLNQVVSREQIKATAHKYATLMQIQGSIPELVGQVAERVYSHRAHDENSIGQVVARGHVAALVAKLLEMQALRGRVLHRLNESPLTIAWLSWFLHRVVTDFVSQNRARAQRVPGMTSLLSAGGQVARTVLPDSGRALDLRVQEFAEHGARFLLRRADQSVDGPVDEAALFEAVMELWDDLAGEPVSSLRDYVSKDDLEDLLVIGYEFWLDLRDTEYLRTLLAEGVDFFFDMYGDFSLRELLEESGVRRADLVEEAHRFGPRAIEALRETGLLESLLRRRLEPFFFSAEVLALLD